MDNATVRIDESYMPIVDQVVKTSKLFDLNVKFAVVAALVGFENQKKATETNRGTKGEIHARVFENNDYQGYVYLIAVADTGSPEILREGNDAEIYKIFEDYMNAGFEIISDWMADNGGDAEATFLKRLELKVLEVMPPDDGEFHNGVVPKF